MWNIQIGKPVGMDACTAVKFRDTADGKVCISRNHQSFWVSEEIFGIGLRIYKDTKEYEALERLLYRDVMDETLTEWVAETVLRHANPKAIMCAIENAKNEAYAKGRNDKAAELRAVLGL